MSCVGVFIDCRGFTLLPPVILAPSLLLFFHGLIPFRETLRQDDPPDQCNFEEAVVASVFRPFAPFVLGTGYLREESEPMLIQQSWCSQAFYVLEVTRLRS